FVVQIRRGDLRHAFAANCVDRRTAPPLGWRAVGGNGITNMRLMGLIVAASLLACASPAFAANGDCVWSNLTPQTRTALLEAYKTKAAGAFGSVRPNATDEEN